MSSEHKKPFFALVVITLACCVFMGYTLRANALDVLLPSDAKVTVTALAEALTIGPEPDAGAGASSVDMSDRDASKARATVAKPSEDNTAEPVARPGFGKHKAESHQVRVREAHHRAKSLRAMRRAAAYRQRVHEPTESAGPESHDEGRDRGHGREHAPGQQRSDARTHGAPWNGPGRHRGHDRGRYGYDRSHHTAKRAHQRGNRGHHGNRGNRGNRGHHRGHGRH